MLGKRYSYFGANKNFPREHSARIRSANSWAVALKDECLAHLRRHFKKVVSLSHGNNPKLGQVFLDLIDEAFTQHQYWRETQDASAYFTWASGFTAVLD